MLNIRFSFVAKCSTKKKSQCMCDKLQLLQCPLEDDCKCESVLTDLHVKSYLNLLNDFCVITRLFYEMLSVLVLLDSVAANQ